VRNYDGSPGDPVPVAYRFTLLGEHKEHRYNDPQWHPSVIVVSLGTNDFSTPLHPGEPWKTRAELHSAFEQTYVAFVRTLRQRNPNALIILWSTDLADGEIASEAKKVVQQLRDSGDQKLDFVEVHGLALNACHYHPSVADDRSIAEKLIQDIDAHKPVWP